MKNKFQRLSKEEKIEALKKFKDCKPDRYKAFKKLRNVSIFAIVYGVLSFIIEKGLFPYLEKRLDTTLIDPSVSIPNLVINCFMLVIGVAMFMFSKNALEKQVNDMLVNELHEKQKQAWAKEQKENAKKQKVEKNKEVKNAKVKKEKVKKSGKTTKSNS